jgi:hypothetical protein
VDWFASWSSTDAISETSASLSSMTESREGVAYLPWNHRAASGGDNGVSGYADTVGVDAFVFAGLLEAAMARSGSSTTARFSFFGEWKLRSIGLNGLIGAWVTGVAGGELSEVPSDRVHGADK